MPRTNFSVNPSNPNPRSNQANVGTTTFPDPWSDEKIFPRREQFTEEFAAAQEDIFSTIEHPVIGVAKNAVSSIKGTNPIVKFVTDFPKLSISMLIAIFLFMLSR